VDVRNKLHLNTEYQNKEDNLYIPFIVSKHLRMSHLKAAYIYFKKRSFSHYIMCSMILQLGGLVNLIIGITVVAAATNNSVYTDSKKGKLYFCYH